MAGNPKTPPATEEPAEDCPSGGLKVAAIITGKTKLAWAVHNKIFG